MTRILLTIPLILIGLASGAQIVQEVPGAPLPDSFTYQVSGDLYERHLMVLDTLDAFFHQYDPARGPNYDLLHLGNLGSPHRQALFLPYLKTGFDFGMRQYDLYKHKPWEFRLFETEIALTDLFYSQSLSQNDGLLNAKFRREFTDGVKFTIDYLRINQVGEFAHQRAKHTAFGTAVLYEAPSGRYTGMFSYESNSIVQEENGGVVDFDLLDSATLPLMDPSIVYLLNAESVNRNRHFQLEHHLHFFRARDTTGQSGKLDIIANTSYDTEFYRFSDDRAEENSEYYSGFLTDDRGVRTFMYARTFANTFALQYRGLGQKAMSLPALRIRAGLGHRFIHVEEEPETNNLQELYLNGNAVFRWKNAFQLNAKGKLGFFDARSNYLLKGDLNYMHQHLGTFTAFAWIYQRRPWLIEKSLFVSQQPVWDIALENPNYQGIGLTWKVPGWKMELTGSLQVLDNHIVYLSDKRPFQITEPEVILALQAQKGFRVGHFGLENRVFFQQYDNAYLALPSWMYKGELYYTGRWFRRNLQVRIGLDYRIFSSFPSSGYFPLTGQFFYTDESDIEPYHAFDAFFSMKIKAFRVFAKLENIRSLWNDDVFYLVEDYPQFEGYFRLGLNMRLYD